MMHFKTLSLPNNTFTFTVMSSPYITTIWSECILLIDITINANNCSFQYSREFQMYQRHMKIPVECMGESLCGILQDFISL